VRRAERRAAFAFLACFACGVALIVVYFTNDNTALEGLLLGAALALFAIALVVIAHRLLPTGLAVDQREDWSEDVAGLAEEQASFDRVESVTRRRFLFASAGGAIVALAAVAVVPLRSLGPNPDDTLAHTPWRAGLRLVNDAGNPIRASDVALDSLVTVFPDGYPDSADGQAVLMRVLPNLLQLSPARSAGAPQGLIAYSKVCTHAGCPVGLYEAQRHELLCPCHQSAFAVLTGAQPVSGPAARALPQLPIAIDADGFLVALGDFTGSVGPAYWNMPQ
jgi:ubiquinol-cytochrome c reductase iron-sulfur subunit